ncbi:MAG: dihydropteroate synthase [Legionellales bacterium]|jgi:dihydropteroate synthase
MKAMPLLMGVLNVTPDSFSDGGQFNCLDKALLHADLMLAQGADIIDIGGESTRPNATPISVQEELDRVLPIISALRSRFDIPISIDTRHAQVMREAVHMGASIINDVNALQGFDTLKTAAELNVKICLMHMQGTPSTMQENPVYQNVVTDIIEFLQDRVEACVNAGILRENIIVDPGFGFGKTYEHNVILLRELKQFQQLHLPLLVGLSRKAWIGLATQKPAHERLAGSIAAAVLAAQHGATILRVHDVGATRDALKVLCAVSEN